MAEKRKLLKRVLVAFDSRGESDASIAEASTLAQLAGAELVGVFVEEAAVERAMGLDSVRVVGSASLRNVDPPSWRRSIRALVSLRRSELSRRAEGLSLAWSFQVEQGELSHVVCRSVTEMDAVVVGQGRRAGDAGGAIVALVTENESQRLVDLACKLGERAGVPVHAFHIEQVGGPRRPRAVARELRRLGARLVVASGRPEAMDATYLEALRAGLSCPLVLVR